MGARAVTVRIKKARLLAVPVQELDKGGGANNSDTKIDSMNLCAAGVFELS